MIKSIRHFGIVVKDLEKSLYFYQDLLGLSIQRRAEESGDYLDKMLALKNAKVTTVKLGAKTGDTLVELLHFKNPTANETSSRKLFDVGPTHIALTVNNLSELTQRLSGAKVKFNSPPQLSPDKKALVAFCYDYDGTALELVEEL